MHLLQQDFIQVLQQVVSLSADALKSQSSLVVASRQGQPTLLRALMQSKHLPPTTSSPSPDPL